MFYLSFGSVPLLDQGSAVSRCLYPSGNFGSTQKSPRPTRIFPKVGVCHLWWVGRNTSLLSRPLTAQHKAEYDSPWGEGAHKLAPSYATVVYRFGRYTMIHGYRGKAASPATVPCRSSTTQGAPGHPWGLVRAQILHDHLFSSCH